MLLNVKFSQPRISLYREWFECLCYAITRHINPACKTASGESRERKRVRQSDVICESYAQFTARCAKKMQKIAFIRLENSNGDWLKVTDHQIDSMFLINMLHYRRKSRKFVQIRFKNLLCLTIWTSDFGLNLQIWDTILKYSKVSLRFRCQFVFSPYKSSSE